MATADVPPALEVATAAGACTLGSEVAELCLEGLGSKTSVWMKVECNLIAMAEVAPGVALVDRSRISAGGLNQQQLRGP